MDSIGSGGTSGTIVQRVLNALHTAGSAEFSVGGETYLIQPENNKGWDYLSIWSTGSAVFCLARAMFEFSDGIDAETVTELLSEPCIGGQCCLELCASGALQWL